MELFRNKYRIPSARLQSWDYGSSGSYFITICTKDRKHFFGKIIDGEMHLNKIGKIAEQEWIKTPSIRPDMNLELDEFIVMPNHFHAIITIHDNPYNSRTDAMHRVSDKDPKSTIKEINSMDRGSELNVNINNENINAIDHIADEMDISDDIDGRDAMHRVCTIAGEKKNNFGAQSKNLASIIRGFKSSVSSQVKKQLCYFAWHPRFHDHIIRNQESYDRIRNYIINNPLKWEEDKFSK